MFKYFIIQIKNPIAEIPLIIALLLTFRQGVKEDTICESEMLTAWLTSHVAVQRELAPGDFSIR